MSAAGFSLGGCFASKVVPWEAGLQLAEELGGVQASPGLGKYFVIFKSF